MYGSRARIGRINPSPETVGDEEWRRLMPDDVIVVSTRMFIERVDASIQYPDDLSSLAENQRAKVLRWLARMAYPNDPEKAEAALQHSPEPLTIEARAEAPAPARYRPEAKAEAAE